jgi:NAD(P)-dependent dehydrogenase (short-subunit alcohol dehydrogenase family)
MERSKVVIISGAGAGIGRELAIGFAGDGYRVVGLGRKAGPLEETGRAITAGRYSSYSVDVSDMAAVANAVGAIAAHVGPVEGMICNAAVYPRAFFLDEPADEWTQSLIINVAGVANCCRAVLPTMLERNYGRIVIVGSLASMFPIEGASVYSVSKGALHVLTKALAVEIDRRRYPNVLINEYLPSATRTAMSEHGDDPKDLYPRIKRLIELPEGGPTGRHFRGFEEFFFDRSPQAAVKRKLSRVLGRA